MSLSRLWARGWQTALVVLVCLAGFGVRLVDLYDPPLDFHPTRQLRSAILARSVYYQLAPDADSQQREAAQALAELETYEPPILETLVGGVYALLGKEALWAARVMNALFWLIGGAALLQILRGAVPFWASWLGLLFYLCLPFGVIASRSFQPEPWMVMWMLLATWGLRRWQAAPNQWRWALITGGLMGMALLVKVVAGFFLLPALAAVILASGLGKMLKRPQTWALAALSAAPVLILYLGFNAQRSGDFLSFWTVALSGLVLTTNFYADWLAMVKGLTGLAYLPAALLGTVLAGREHKPLLIGWWAGYALYGLLFPYQYTTHEYYHLPLVALIGLSLPFLAAPVVERLKQEAWIWRLAALGVVLAAAGYALFVARSTLVAKNYPYEPESWRRVGEAIPPGSSVVALTADYGMRLRYYGWRSIAASWPAGADLKLFSMAGSEAGDPLDTFASLTEGRQYFLVTAFSELDAQPELKQILTEHYPVFAEGNGFVVYDLQNPLPEAK